MSAPTTLMLVVENTGPQDRFPPQYNARIKVILFAPTAASRKGKRAWDSTNASGCFDRKGHDTSTHSPMARMQSAGHIRRCA